ncbi:MAG: spore cortex biosynthesis protein YabQ [Clostridia bacterium]|nr:spore cortex biosynthesis protein YabQ [Clostridia bacterium]
MQASGLYVFFSCLLCGTASGVVYDLLYPLKVFLNHKKLNFALDILFFLFFSAIYIFASVLFAFPAFRLYMFVACCIGLLLYLKSCHRILDFFVKRLYNILKKK